MKILVTGTAGFIGFHLANQLLERGDYVTGLDNINDYYDTNLKYDRLRESGINPDKIAYGTQVKSETKNNYSFIKLNLSDKSGLANLFTREKFDKVCHLAAQAGVRYSLTNPDAYIESNIVGFMNILEMCRHNSVKHLAYASSSSVYGLNENQPFSTKHHVDHPISLYAASKKSNELMAHTYSYLYNLPTTGLRFFTVYGPWGRPDMALFIFTKAMMEGQPLEVFNSGEMKRDFTYIDDIVKGIISVIDNPPQGNVNWAGKQPIPDSSPAPYKIYNIGNNKPVQLMDFIKEIEKNAGLKAEIIQLPLQPGDVPSTHADVSDLIDDLNYSPSTPIELGIKKFMEWYKAYYTNY